VETTVPYFLHSDDNLANAFGSALLGDALCKDIQNELYGNAVLLQQGTPVAVSGRLLSVATHYSPSLQRCQKLYKQRSLWTIGCTALKQYCIRGSG
jgi:hypothetical protein